MTEVFHITRYQNSYSEICIVFIALLNDVTEDIKVVTLIFKSFTPNFKFVTPGFKVVVPDAKIVTPDFNVATPDLIRGPINAYPSAAVCSIGYRGEDCSNNPFAFPTSL